MKDHEINIIIAEACGKGHWTIDLNAVETLGGISETGIRVTDGQGKSRFESSDGSLKVFDVKFGFPPDYCNDLNAMHEAEETLTLDQMMVYDRLLPQVTKGFTWHATARERAETFLCTLGKYVACALLCLTLTGCKTTDNSEQQMEYSRVIPGFGNTLP